MKIFLLPLSLIIISTISTTAQKSITGFKNSVKQLKKNLFEFTDFMVNVLKVTDVLQNQHMMLME